MFLFRSIVGLDLLVTNYWPTLIYIVIIIIIQMVELLDCQVVISPWAKYPIFTYRYHLGGQNLVMFFMYAYAQCII